MSLTLRSHAMRKILSSATVGYVNRVSARTEYKRRIQQRQTVLFGSIAATMAVLLVFAMLFWTGIIPFPFEREFSAKPDPNRVVTPCVAEGTAPVELSAISASVYNSTSRTGIATDASQQLAALGVAVVTTGNWSSQSLNEPARIQAGPQGVAAAYTLAQYIPGAIIQYNGDLTGESLNIILGADWSALASADTVAANNPSGTLTSADECTDINEAGK
ncbi:LytR C-terminal domain-containing protein [Arcanobacterium haemolyticum]|nr:LytR C-terminal domain-containing protein [Arcanobacterium haemolyticum]